MVADFVTVLYVKVKYTRCEYFLRYNDAKKIIMSFFRTRLTDSNNCRFTQKLKVNFTC